MLLNRAVQPNRAVLLNRTGSRLSAVVGAVLVLALLGVGCSTRSEPSAEALDPETSVVDTSAPGEPGAPVGPHGIPELVTSSLGGAQGDWSGLKAAGGRLYALERPDDVRLKVVRLDPESGEVLASAEVNDVEGSTVAPSAVVMLHKDRRFVTLLDPITLEVRHEVDLGESSRAGITGDTPRSDDFWFGLRRLDVDQLQDVYTDMAAVRLDLSTGEIVERVEAPPCGATSVTQLGDHLVTGIACAENVATIDRTTGEARSYEGFPVGVTVIAHDGTAWLRWKDLGYLGKIRPGDESIETLDLNTVEVLLSETSPQMAGPRGIWVAGTAVDQELPLLLTVVDPDSFTVVGRAWTPAPVAFLGDVGYLIVDQRLATFDPDSVVGGIPDETVRPATGAPAAAELSTPQEQAVVDAFTTVFDPGSTNADAAVHLVDDPTTLDLRGRLLDLASRLYPGVAPRVTAIAVGDDTASLAYVFLLDGQVAFVPLTASLEFDGTNWRVTKDTVCRLAAQAAISEC